MRAFIALVQMCTLLFGMTTFSYALIYKPELSEDGKLDFMGLSAKYGHRAEEYDLTTSDGYILKLFHIPGKGKGTVFLMHGIINCADTFLIRGNTSIVISLADAGYDLWLTNARGSRFSRRHVSLDPDNDKEFWDFSFHELGTIDLPESIDFVLEKTGQSKLSAIGHSQGTTIFYVLCSEKPEYNDKINIMISLAPICHLDNLKPELQEAAALWPKLSPTLKMLGVEELVRFNSTISKVAQTVCTRGKAGYKVCVEGIIFFLAGADPGQWEPEFSKTVFGHIPVGTSRKSLDHFVQTVERHKFANFDYGPVKNLKTYRSIQPPEYPISKITMPVALLVGKNDALAVEEDVRRLYDELPNPVYFHVMEREEFNHADFIWGRDLKEDIVPILFDLLQQYG